MTPFMLFLLEVLKLLGQGQADSLYQDKVLRLLIRKTNDEIARRRFEKEHS